MSVHCNMMNATVFFPIGCRSWMSLFICIKLKDSELCCVAGYAPSGRQRSLSLAVARVAGNRQLSIEMNGIVSLCRCVSLKAPFTLQATLSDKATRSHSFQWRAGDFQRHGACPATQQSSESFNFMQMKSDFRERQPIGKKTVELTWSFSQQ